MGQPEWAALVKDFYFSGYETRRPPAPTRYDPRIESLFQGLATATALLGAWYLWWRWSASINPDALWLSVPVALAETGSYIGLLLFFYNLWSWGDTPRQPPPLTREQAHLDGHGPIRVDFLIATCNEDPELVRLTIRDALSVRIPAGVVATVRVLDDGCRTTLQDIAQEEGVAYHPRRATEGYKAGNLRNGMVEGDGDFLVICDADLRLFPGFLEQTLGYFRDPDIAWVQTPHWFYDIPEGRPVLPRRLSEWLGRRVGARAAAISRWRVGQDPFGSDPGLFFDVIQRRRNRTGGSFCCGAASVHRRQAIEDTATMHLIAARAATDQPTAQARARADLQSRGLRPFDFHVSEDIFSSIRLQKSARKWRSVYHPYVESRLLSPWDLKSWAIQRLKYAGGSLDIAFFGRSVLAPGLNFSHRLFYAATFFSYVSSIFVAILLLAPIASLLTGATPVAAYSTDFFAHLLPFLLVNEAALIAGTWGHDAFRGRVLTVGCVWLNLYALALVLRRRPIRFRPTPKERAGAGSWRFALPHIIYAGLGLIALAWGAIDLAATPTPEAKAAFIVNTTWLTLNMTMAASIIRAGFWSPS